MLDFLAFLERDTQEAAHKMTAELSSDSVHSLGSTPTFEVSPSFDASPKPASMLMAAEASREDVTDVADAALRAIWWVTVTVWVTGMGEGSVGLRRAKHGWRGLGD